MLEKTTTDNINYSSLIERYLDIIDESDNIKNLSLILKLLCEMCKCDYSLVQLCLENEYRANPRSIEELLILKNIRFFFALPIYSKKGLIGYIGLISLNTSEKIFEESLGNIKLISYFYD